MDTLNVGGLIINVTLTGPFLAGLRTWVVCDEDGAIVRCGDVSCAWSGSQRFHNWFCDMYNPVVYNEDGQEAFRFVIDDRFDEPPAAVLEPAA